MTAAEVDAYLLTAPSPQRAALARLRESLLALLPEAIEGIAYGVPCVLIGGKRVAGYSFSAGHCTYFPMSGSITTVLAEQLRGYVTAKGSVRFPAGEPLPAELVRVLVEARLEEIGRIGR